MRLVDVHLGGPTKYLDQPAIPDRFARDFQMWVWEDGEAGGELRVGGPAPEGANDCVSETIISHGVWEVPQSICLLSAFAANPDALFLDFGAHIGWYPLLALTSGLRTIALDGSERGLGMLANSRYVNGVPPGRLSLLHAVIDNPGVIPPSAGVMGLIVKIDVEGAENHVVKGLWPSFQMHQISHCLMEISPVFDSYYGDLLGDIFDLGYVGYVMPPKRPRPPVVADVHRWLRAHGYRLDYLTRNSMKDWVNAQHQFDVILFTPEAKWG